MDASSIWDQLKTSGLALESNDRDFVAAFSRALGLQLTSSVESELQRVHPPGDILVAIVYSCEQFDGMAQDIWNMIVPPMRVSATGNLAENQALLVDRAAAAGPLKDTPCRAPAL